MLNLIIKDILNDISLAEEKNLRLNIKERLNKNLTIYVKNINEVYNNAKTHVDDKNMIRELTK